MPARLMRLSVLSLIVAVASCSPAVNPKVVGKWNTPTGGSIEFKADGTAIMAGAAGSREVQYRQPDAQTIEFSRPDGNAAIRWKLKSVSETELVIQDVDGALTRLARASGAGVILQSDPPEAPAAPVAPAPPY